MVTSPVATERPPSVVPVIAPSRMTSERPAIEVNGLVRKFEDFTAVNGISFAVPHGEVFGFLGPNGAGKSTTIKMLCTLLRPTGGSAYVNGYNVQEDPSGVRNSIGVIFQDFSLDDRITAEENLRFHCMIYHVPRSERKERIARVLEMVNLTDRAGTKVKTFSGGMKRRLEIARGLLHRPAVLFLDEPTVGLDPQTRQNIWEHITELRKEHGITIFMTTHYMDEAEYCDRIAIMDHAQVIALDTPASLKASLGGDKVRLKTTDDREASDILRSRSGIEATQEPNGLVFKVDNGDEFVPTILRDFPVPIMAVDVTKPTLNDVFLEITGRAIREEEAASRDRLRAQMQRRGRKGA